MKKLITLTLAAAAALSLCACGSKTSGVDLVLASQIEADKEMPETKPLQSETAARQPETIIPETETANEDGIDVDLSKMSGTMAYAEVYNMMVYPEDYIGKKIRIRGPYYASYLEDTDMYYHYVIITDATACCESGIEVIWDNSDHVYPDEYPDNMTEVEATGIFNTYEENGYTYGYIAVDGLVEK